MSEMPEPTLQDLMQYDEENNTYCEVCGGTGMQFDGDVHMGDCPECCGSGESYPD